MRARARAISAAGLIWAGLTLAAPVQAAAGTRVALDLFIDGTGMARASLLIATLLPKPEELGPALGQVLGTGATDVDSEVDLEKHVVTCSARSRKPFDAPRHHVTGEIKFDPLISILRPAGATALEVHLSHPRAAYTRCPRLTNNPAAGAGPWVEYFGTVPLQAESTKPIQFDFGYQDRELILAFVPLLLLVPIPALWIWTTRRRSFQRQAPASSLLGIPTFLPFAACGVLVGLLQADLVTWFILGLVEPPGRIWSEIGLFLAVPLLGIAGAHALLPRQNPTYLSLTNALPWTIPAVLAAIALASSRDAGFATAWLWWVSAGAACIVILVQRAWVSRAGLGRAGGSEPGLDAQGRATALARWWIGTSIIVSGPITAGWLIRKYQLDQPVSTISAGAMLILTLVLYVCAQNWSVKAWCANLPPLRPRNMSSHRIASILSLLTRLGLAWLACTLLDLPLDLEHGDEGFIALTCVFISALVAELRNAGPIRPAGASASDG